MTGLFGGKPKAPAPPPAIPELPPVTPLVDPEDVQLKARKRRASAMQRNRSGRQSTILSDRGGDRLGG